MANILENLIGNANSENTDAVMNTAFDVYTEQNDEKLNESQNKTEDELSTFMQNIALGELEKFKNMENIFGGVFKNVDWKSFLDPEALKEKLLDFAKEKADELKDKALNAWEDFKGQAIEFLKEKLTSLIGTAIGSIFIPDEIFLSGLSGTYYVGFADLDANGGYIRKIVLEHDYPKTLKWLNGEYGYVYDYIVDRSLCSSDIRMAIKHGCWQVSFYIIDEVYNNSYKPVYEEYKRYKELNTFSDQYKTEFNSCKNKLNSIKRFIVSSIKDTIVYSYQTLLPGSLSSHVDKWMDLEKSEPLFLPKYLGETDDVYNGAFFLTESDLDRMVTKLDNAISLGLKDLDSNKITFERKLVTKTIEAIKEANIANLSVGDIYFPRISFEEHDEVKHSSVREMYKTDTRTVKYRNKLIRTIYVYLTDSNLWGNNIMVHCYFYSLMKMTAENPLSDGLDMFANSPLSSFLKGIIPKNELSGVEYTKLIESSGLLLKPATLADFGDISGLLNLFFSNFPTSGGDNKQNSEILTGLEESKDLLKNLLKNNKYKTDDYIKEYLYINLDNKDIDTLLTDVDGVFNRIRNTITTIIENKDTVYKEVYKLIGSIMSTIHDKYFNKKHAGSTDKGNLSDETFELAKAIFSKKEYTKESDYLDLYILYRMYIFYYLADRFPETNTKDISFNTNIATPLQDKMTLRRMFRIIDHLVVFYHYLGKEYILEQDNTISVFIKDFLNVYNYLINAKEFVPLNTVENIKTVVKKDKEVLGLTNKYSSEVDSQLKIVSMKTKYESVLWTNIFLSDYTFKYLFNDRYTNIPYYDNTHDYPVYDTDKIINKTGFHELYMNGLMNIFDIIFKLFKNGIYTTNDLGNGDIEDPVYISSVLNSIPEYIDKRGYLSHLKYNPMTFGVSFKKINKI